MKKMNATRRYLEYCNNQITYYKNLIGKLNKVDKSKWTDSMHEAESRYYLKVVSFEEMKEKILDTCTENI